MSFNRRPPSGFTLTGRQVAGCLIALVVAIAVLAVGAAALVGLMVNAFRAVTGL